MKDPRTWTLQMVTFLTLIAVAAGGFLWAIREASTAVAQAATRVGLLSGLEALAVALYVFILLFPFTLLLALALVVGALKLAVMARDWIHVRSGKARPIVTDFRERVDAPQPGTRPRAA
jgi:hypothetical protein